jgi:hypothetical protein
VQRFIDVLKLATLWEMENDRQAAIHKLQKYSLVELSAVRRMELAHTYSIPSWINAAFRELVRKELCNFSASNLHAIGFQTFTILSKAKEAIKKNRRAVAMIPPQILHCEECKTPQLCDESWEVGWWWKMGRKILRPERLFAMRFPGEANRAVEELDVPGVTPGCLEWVKEWVAQSSGFDGEEKIVDAAVKKLEELEGYSTV